MSVSAGGKSVEVAFDTPFADETLESIRWYVEEYGKSQFGGEIERAKEVEAAMIQGGVALHELLCNNEAAGRAIDEALASDLDLEVAVSAASHGFLSIPWELTFSEKQGAFLASKGVAFSRTHLPETTRTQRARRSPGPLRVLLIIARPTGLGAVPADTVAASVTRLACRPDARIELHVLRPPTIARLREVLSDDHQYDLVHFDGHGEFLSIADSGGRTDRDQGFLFFEQGDCRPDPVGGRDIARHLKAENVPVFILNACRSAVEGQESPMSSVASQLLVAGSPGVVAMAYSVRADAVRVFMDGFYGALASGKSLQSSVADARSQLVEARDGASANDWFVPLLYLGHSKNAADFTGVQSSQQTPVLRGSASFESFFGRERELLLVERAFAAGSPIVVAWGVLGTGKTEFLDRFSAWFKLSNAVDESIYVDIRECKTASEAFERTDSQLAGLHRRAIDGFRRSGKLLIAWDHAERVLRSPDERSLLSRVCDDLRGTGVRLLVATCEPLRAEFGVASVQFTDLSNAEAARRLLEGSSQSNRLTLLGDRSNIMSIVECCSFHPRSVDLLLGAMEALEPERASSLLQWGIPDKGDGLLDPRVVEVFEQLSDSARSVLPLLGVFGATVNPLTLCTFTDRGLKHDIFAEWYDSPISVDLWRACLEEAAQRGLVRRAMDSIFELPPSVRIFLRHALKGSNPAGERLCEAMTKGMVELYAALATAWANYEEPILFAVVQVEESNVIRAIRAAVRNQRLPEAIAILRLLDYVWRQTGRSGALSDFISEIQLLAGEDLVHEDRGKEFWSLLRGCQALAAEAMGDRSLVEEIDTETVRVLGDSEDGRLVSYIVDAEVRLASLAAESGSMAEARSHLDRAERVGKGRLSDRISRIRGSLGRRANEIHDVAGSLEMGPNEPDSPASAIYAEQLGKAAVSRGDYDAAAEHYSAALRVWSRLGRKEEGINARSMLADAMVGKGQFALALRVYQEVLRGQEQTSQHGRAASTALLIGQVLEQTGNFKEARRWCESAIPVMKRLGMQLEVGHVYHELAIIALSDPEHSEPVEAVNRLQDAVRTYRDLGSPMHEGSSLFLLGQVHMSRGEYSMARSALRESRDVWTKPEIVSQGNSRDLRLAQVELRLGNPVQAIELLAQISNRVDFRVVDEVSMEIRELLSFMREQLGRSRLREIWQQAGGNAEALS